MIAHFLLAAPSSGSGKTTLTLGLLRAFRNRGYSVQPFKCGPDYIDTLHQSAAAGRASLNLDLFLSSEEHVSHLYTTADADIAITEGVMGLFDGADRMKASSAAIAELLDIPIILIVNAKAMAYSAAALLFGFKNFRPGLRIAGVIFNQVNTPTHYRILAEAAEDAGIEALGYLPTRPEFAIPSRHLGLRVYGETDYEAIINGIAQALPETVDLDRLLSLTTCQPFRQVTSRPQQRGNYHIAIARDEAFCFRYEQNIRMLESFGNIHWFSPLHDTSLPEADLLYLPGGYPELAAEALSTNTFMRQAIADYCLDGGRCYAECGGLMYLGESLTDPEGRTFPMAGVFPLQTAMHKLTLGYREVRWEDHAFRGHEFHYSAASETDEIASVAEVLSAKGIPVPTPFYRKQHTIASYIHLYWGEDPTLLTRLFSFQP
ncbi:cobyrinate a,c-diamide synthase [Siphonobacter aquaeclarae]|uniref:Cobyrinate a,c-diamide synthase n=1 Tax=Siphonobacter aquaeclarae TaxID=563176 RepID=A0A1G9IE18_9BACT|nr:cobyrinate a,c-diamide synthase [Siphonobacter aquaeclarae]SDL23447.1 hydrogenobyrinic acid a,c-diamide synthase (glutamine-hydrolysing) /cobyrinate a,c-diamide synthase [Siphonobacter aquaeclarae]